MTQRETRIWRAAIISALFVSAISYVPAAIIQAVIPAVVPTANKQGNSSKFQLAGTNSGTNGNLLCNDASGNATDSACGGAAASVPFSGITTGSNVAATMTVGTGAGLLSSGTGFVNANRIRQYTVAGLPGAGTAGQFAEVTDGASATDCTVGSGSTKVTCVDNGAAWVALGGSSPSSFNLSGTLASLPAAGTAGRIFIPTDSLFDILRDNGSSWNYFIQGRQLTAKPATTSVNLAGPSVTLTAYGPGARLSTTGANNFNVAALMKAPAAATFTFTVGVISNQNPNGSGGCGLALSVDTNSAHGVITFGTFQYAGGGLGQAFPNANAWSNFTGTSAGAINNSPQSSNVSISPIYFRVTEDVSNRTYFVSQDNGVTFQQWFQEAVTAHLTTGDIGVYYLVGNANTLGGSCTFVDWVES
jgi:hypothetical protein